jgi:hypothetical protein
MTSSVLNRHGGCMNVITNAMRSAICPNVTARKLNLCNEKASAHGR